MHGLPMRRKVFQSTLRRTERLSDVHKRQEISVISIHAPTNGATSERVRLPHETDYFNPRSDERSDGVSINDKQRV